MKREIPFQDGKVVFFKEIDFWNSLIEKCGDQTKIIYIATYNFNFKKYDQSFYKKLTELANKGIEISLLYSKTTFGGEDHLEFEDIFENFVLCAQLKTNHSKIFICDDFAYIGSANFSFGSDNNYECGVIFENKEIVLEILKFYRVELLAKSEFINVPLTFDPFSLLPLVLDISKELTQVSNKKELYEDRTRELIPELRYLDEVKNHLLKVGCPLTIEFDWWELYGKLYENKPVDDYEFNIFKSYLNELSSYLINVINIIDEHYKATGKLEFLRKNKVIKVRDE